VPPPQWVPTVSRPDRDGGAPAPPSSGSAAAPGAAPVQPANRAPLLSGPDPATLPALKDAGNQAGVRARAAAGRAAAEADVAQHPLRTPAQVRAAIAFYAADRSRWSVPVVKELQAALGVPETGTMDEPSVQAVARVQAATADAVVGPTDEPAAVRLQPVDGRATPTVLPRIMAQGDPFLHATADLFDGVDTDFDTAGLRNLYENWSYLSVLQRGEALIDNANGLMAGLGMPFVTWNIDNRQDRNGQFEDAQWHVRLSLGQLTAPVVDKASFARTVASLHHELRHAWQAFLVARKIVGDLKGKDDDAIVARIAKLGIAETAARAALGKPLAPGSLLYLRADDVYQQLYGRNVPAAKVMYNRLGAAMRERERLDRTADRTRPADVRALLHAGHALSELWYRRFTVLGDEYDAHFVESRVAAQASAFLDDWYPVEAFTSRTPEGHTVKITKEGRTTTDTHGRIIDARPGAAEYRSLLTEHKKHRAGTTPAP